MAGRYPFDPSGGRGPPQQLNPSQLSSAQMRAALGLTPPVVAHTTTVDEAAAFLQAQAQQQRQQQEQLQLRQLLLQERLEQHMQEQQLRAIGEQLQDFPDLQQHYQSLLITEQIQRRREQVAQAQMRFQEELRRAQQLGGLRSEEVAAAAAAQHQQRQQQQQQQHQQAAALAKQHQQQQQSPPPPPPPPVAVLPVAEQLPASALRALEARTNEAAVAASIAAYSVGGVTISTAPSPPPDNINDSNENGNNSRHKRSASLDMTEYDYTSLKRIKETHDDHTTASPSLDDSGDLEQLGDAAADLVVVRQVPQSFRKGTVAGLLTAADDHEQMDGAATIIRELEQVEWSDSDEDDGGKIEFSSNPDECIASPRFKSTLPRLPVEPVLDTNEAADKPEDSKKKELDDSPGKEDKKTTESEQGSEGRATPSAKNGKGSKKKKKLSAVLDYPVPIDTWWPSLNGMRRERRNAGETSDEDAFEDPPAGPGDRRLFRANERKIRNRLTRLLEPGVLEKQPHCRLHRVRTRQKKNSTAPEFLYCWQVTEIYPGDTIMCCSRCGTWRHAACGGHYKTYSVRENTEEPFIAVCENCHEEERFLRDYPRGEKRLESQRIDHMRRALATSAVMKQASFSKHGGTYKWPLGSVSATHIAGHTRSVHARHDKAEKQWSDMGLRLSRGFGYRPKERVKSRTKELERLMVSVEDAEAYTERHNMLHFLMRDTERDKPVGYTNELMNLFDPEVPHHSSKSEPNDRHEDNKDGEAHEDDSYATMISCCARKGCQAKPRFDSIFCSDACGVLTLEADLMQTMFETSDLHPSVLRP